MAIGWPARTCSPESAIAWLTEPVTGLRMTVFSSRRRARASCGFGFLDLGAEVLHPLGLRHIAQASHVHRLGPQCLRLFDFSALGCARFRSAVARAGSQSLALCSSDEGPCSDFPVPIGAAPAARLYAAVTWSRCSAGNDAVLEQLLSAFALGRRHVELALWSPPIGLWPPPRRLPVPAIQPARVHFQAARRPAPRSIGSARRSGRPGRRSMLPSVRACASSCSISARASWLCTASSAACRCAISSS